MNGVSTAAQRDVWMLASSLGGSGKRVAKAREIGYLVRRDGWLSQERWVSKSGN